MNNSVSCSSATTFRLASYSEERLRERVAGNLACLRRIFEFNAAHGIGFFRISSQLVPFASHPVCRFAWQKHFAGELKELGSFARRHRMRLSMHPDQFVLLNALDDAIVASSIAELRYHCEVLDGMEMGTAAKVQIHVGGVYGDKEAAIDRFVSAYGRLPDLIRRRLVIENDDRLFSVDDCLKAHARTGVPILLDTFHHACLPGEMTLEEAFAACRRTWRSADGPIMLDYSSQQKGERRGKHAEHIDVADFTSVMSRLDDDCDVMLEIRDKEASALRALETLRLAVPTRPSGRGNPRAGA